MTDDTGEELHEAADQARARLLDTVVRLEQRERKVVDVTKQVAHSARRFSLPVVGLVAVGITALVVHGLAFRKRPRARDRWRLLETFWRHPDRELRAERRSFGVEVLRSSLLTLATSALAIPLRHAVRTLGDRAGQSLAPKPEAGPQNV
jgi:hypothetical protein